MNNSIAASSVAPLFELVDFSGETIADRAQPAQQDSAAAQLLRALRHLASVCDGALARDEQGYNSTDSRWGHAMADWLADPAHELTESVIGAIYNRLTKYSHQLESAGCPLPSRSAFAPKTAAPAAELPQDRITLDGSIIRIYFHSKAHFQDLLAITKGLTLRRFVSGIDPHWETPAAMAWQVVEAFGDQAIEIAPAIRELAGAQPREATAEARTTLESSPSGRRVTMGEDGDLVIRFPYNPDLVTLVKSLSSRRFDPKTKQWTAPARVADEIMAKLTPQGFTIADDVASLARQQVELQDMSRAMDAEAVIPGLKGTLLPFQRAGVNYIEKIGGRAIVGDAMGLGKTVEALAYLQAHPDLRPTVIVVPATVKRNWAIHIDGWMSDRKTWVIVEGRHASLGQVQLADIVIINYDILGDWADTFREIGYKAVVFDEAHYLKTLQFGKDGIKKSSKRASAAYALASGCDKVLFLTGTPAMNNPSELFPLLHMTDPKAWPDFFSFAIRYCGGYRDPNTGYWSFSGASNLEELCEKVRGCMVRRLKEDVLKELPPKRRATVVLPLTNRAEYEAILYETADWMRENPKGGAAHLAKIEHLKQAVVKGKLPAAISWIQDFLSNGEKLVVFAHHTFVLDALMDAFGAQAVRLSGETSQGDRQLAVERFQKDPTVRLFVGNIQAAGIGITLTAASNTAFLELMWRPGDHSQAEDRVHRIGQEADSVTAWYLLAEETIDEDICELLDSKRQVLEMALDGAEGDLQFGILQDLIQRVFKITKPAKPAKTAKTRKPRKSAKTAKAGAA